MDWTTIGYVTLASLAFSVNFAPWYHYIKAEFGMYRYRLSERVCVIFLAGLLATTCILVEGMLVVALAQAGNSIINWGIGNFLLSLGIVTTIVGGPFLAKPVALRVFVAIPHYILKFFADCKSYKATLNATAPIKRSIYEITEE